MENKIDIKDAVWTVFLIYGADYKGMDLDDIAYYIQENISDYAGENIDVIRKQVSYYLANATTKIVKGKRVIDKESKYERVKNGKGGFKKGMYKLRKPKKKKEPKPAPLPITPRSVSESLDKNYVGSAGEMAVCSELLFREYNVSQMAVDDGVDVVAIKNGKTFYIQVKTTQVLSNCFSITIKSKSFERYNSNDCYYIVVARAKENMYLVFTADDIKRMITNEAITKGEKQISVSFSQSDGHVFVKSEKVDYALNSFERIV